MTTCASTEQPGRSGPLAGEVTHSASVLAWWCTEALGASDQVPQPSHIGDQAGFPGSCLRVRVG